MNLHLVTQFVDLAVEQWRNQEFCSGGGFNKFS